MFKCISVLCASVMIMVVMTMSGQSAWSQSIEIDGAIYRDPTQPPGAVYQESSVVQSEQVPRITLSNFTLSFVRSGGLNPVAVINNRTLTEGDEVGGARVARIQAGAVVLEIGGQEHVLNLYRQPVRQNLTGGTLEN